MYQDEETHEEVPVKSVHEKLVIGFAAFVLLAVFLKILIF